MKPDNSDDWHKKVVCVCGKTHTVENLDGLRRSIYQAHSTIYRLEMALQELLTMVYPLGDAYELINEALYGDEDNGSK